MKEFIFLIIGLVLFLGIMFVGAEYELYKNEWAETFIAGVGLYIVVLVVLTIWIRKKEHENPDVLPDTKYTHRFEK